MGKYKTALGIFVIAALVVLGFVLPTMVSGLSDRRLERGTEAVEVDAIQFESGQNMTVFQRLQLLHGSDNVLSIEAGNIYDENTAFEKAVSELAPLMDQLGIDFNFNSCWTERSDFSLFYDFNHANTSMITWSFALRDSGGDYEITGTMEEESGKLLSVSCNVISESAVPLFSAEEDDSGLLTKVFVSYWGVDAEGIYSNTGMEAVGETENVTDSDDSGNVTYPQSLSIILTEDGEYLEIMAEIWHYGFYI